MATYSIDFKKVKSIFQRTRRVRLMLVPKSGQKTLFDVEVFLPPSKVFRLNKSWAAPFQQHVLPLLVELEPAFAPY